MSVSFACWGSWLRPVGRAGWGADRLGGTYQGSGAVDAGTARPDAIEPFRLAELPETLLLHGGQRLDATGRMGFEEAGGSLAIRMLDDDAEWR